MEQQQKLKDSHKGEGASHYRLAILAAIFLCMFIRLTVRLFKLQIVDGEHYLTNYLQITTRQLDIPGVRGNIYDRNGNLLAYNELAYVVTIQDNGEYKTPSEKNKMFFNLVRILNRHGNQISGKFEIAIDESGEMYFTTGSKQSHQRFLCSVFGLKSPDQLTGPKGKFPADISARELFEDRFYYYELEQLKDDRGNPVIMTDREALQMIDIWYSMGLTAYKKYKTVQISSYIAECTKVDILENSSRLPGVHVEERTIRRYNDSIYFSPIVGYVGHMQEGQLEKLRKENPEYESDDIVGKSGIEMAMETTLQGVKGHQSAYVDNVGHIREIFFQADPQAGHNVYLTLDRDLQKGVYHLAEQQLAGIVASKLYNGDDRINQQASGSSRMIPIKDAWFQLINNQVISLDHVKGDAASDCEARVFETLSAARATVLESLKYELNSPTPAALCDLPEDMRDYMVYVVSFLSSDEVGILKDEEIDKTGSGYISWKEKNASLREYLYAGIHGGWIHTETLSLENKYLDLDAAYEELTRYILASLEEDQGFQKKLYKHLIEEGAITGCDLMGILYAQGLLTYNEQEIQMLESGNEDYAFKLIKDKISCLELTPAQMALEPCTAGVVVTDVTTGKVLALVTYPGYDGNRLSGTMDAAYYRQLLNDMSNPLYNKATQVLKAPASTFKPVMAAAALEEGVVSLDETVTCSGLYDKVAVPIKCWVYPGRHGAETITEAIQNSCNYYFAELAARLSADGSGTYDSEQGIRMIQKYAGLFGLDHTSGVEIPETPPHMATEDPERSAMGQADHAYTNIQLSRYVTAIANRGTVYEFCLVDRITDPSGREESAPSARTFQKLDFSEMTWDVVQEGMRRVISNNPAASMRRLFQDLEVPVAGKTGTTQESKNHANHAFFISYGPYDHPEIAVTVNIPNGYTSGNAASLGKSVYRLYFGYLNLSQIMSRDAGGITNIDNID